MAAGKSTSTNTYVNPIDPNLDPQGYALYELNNAPKGSLAIDNPTATQTPTSTNKASVFDYLSLGINGTSNILNSIAATRLAKQGLSLDTASQTDKAAALREAQAQIDAEKKAAQDAGTGKSNTLYYVIGGVLVAVIVFLMVRKQKPA